LGLKDDPYVNNPMRVPDFALTFQQKQKDKKAWAELVELFEHVQAHPKGTSPAIASSSAEDPVTARGANGEVSRRLSAPRCKTPWP
jgi:hypothetical protein